MFLLNSENSGKTTCIVPFMKVSFRNNILLFFAFLSLGVIGLGLETFENNAKYKNTVYWIEHTERVLYETEQVLVYASDIESSQRGFVLTSNPQFLSPLMKVKKNVFNHLQNLKLLTKDNPAQQVRIDTLSYLIQKKIAFSDSVVQTRKEKGLDAARNLITAGIGMKYMNSLGQTLALLQAEENRLLLIRKNLNEHSTLNLGITFLALLIAIVLALLIASAVVWNNENARKKAEKLLNENQQLLQSIIDNTSSMINLKDKDGKYLLVNKEYQKLFSEYNSLIGKTVFELYPEKIATVLAAENRRVFNDKKLFEFEHDLEIKGNLYHFISIKFPLFKSNGDVYAIGNISTNITKIRKQSNLIQDLYDHAPSGYYSLDGNGTFINANKTTLQWLGYEKEELIGKPFKDILTAECLKDFEKTFPDFKEKGTLTDKEFTYIRKDGTFMPVLLNATAEKDNNSNFLYSRSTIFDITQRKKLEEELKQINKELESFTYSISHDLRAPLRIMNGYAGIVTNEYSDKLDEDAKRMLNNIIQNANRMGQLIDDLLNFSRLGRKELMIHVTDMNALVKEIINEHLKLVPAEKYKIITGDLGKAFCDSSLIRQVWQNLVSNAFKYSRQQAEPVIEINCEMKEKENVYSIKDNGTGFDMNYYDKLFAVFQRLHKVTEYEGTGVGLALVQKIIQKHGSRIWAESEINKGATFYFSISNTNNIIKNNSN